MFNYILLKFEALFVTSMFNLKLIALCVIFYLFGNYRIAFAQSDDIINKSASGDIVLKNSLLWKVQKSGRPTSYLFGTFHLLPLSDFQISDKVLTALELADKVVLELDLNDPAMQKDFMKHVTRQDSLTLKEALSPEDYRKLNDILLGAFGTDASMFNNWHPAMVGTFLIKFYIDGAPASYDASLLEMANQKNKSVVGLETVEEQLKVFSKLPYEVQIEDLEEMLRNEEKVRNTFSEMIALYKTEDINGLYNLFIALNRDQRKIDLLLNDRNRNWIDRIEVLTKNNSSLVAVGAGHLAGRYGLISLLREEGFTVTAIEE